KRPVVGSACCRSRRAAEDEADTNDRRLTGRGGEGARAEAEGSVWSDHVILVVAEQRGGRLQRVSREAIAAARLLAVEQPVEAVVLGANVGEAAEELAHTPVSAVHRVEHPVLVLYTPDGYVAAMHLVLEQWL